MAAQKITPITIRGWCFAALSTISICLLTLMIIPLHVGLSAGTASLSIVIFAGFMVTALFGLRYVTRAHPRFSILLIVGVLASLVGLIYPQLLMKQTADEHGVKLSFQPGQYLRFSGNTSILPTKTLIYKETRDAQLKAAYYSPDQAKTERPSVVILHGGGWRYGNYLQTGEWPRILTQAGFNVISIQYRLSSETEPSWEKAPRDVHDAMIYIHSNAAKLGIKQDAIHLMGQSAGGHLALLEAYREGGVASAISLYAPIDLELDYNTSIDKSAELNFIGSTPQENPDRYRQLSPSRYVTVRTPRTLIIQGQRDDLVAEANATVLAQKLADASIEHRLILLPLTGHSFENQHGGLATQIAEQAVVNFLND